MRISHGGRLIGLVAVITAMVVLPGRALAAGPSITPYPGNGTYTFPNTDLTSACGFTNTVIMETDVFNQNIIVYSNGTTKSIESGPNSITYSTLYGTLSGPIAGFGETILNPDGTITIVGTGPSNLVAVPGSGLVMGSAGHFVGVFNPATHQFTVIQDVGVRPDNLAAFCTYLGPPGYQFPG